MEDRELHPASRWDWEQIILRARLGGLITGTGKRGGVSAVAFKAVALTLSSHADADGSRVFPGDAVLAVEAEADLRTVQAVRRKLVEMGLIERVRAGARRERRGDEYRLTLPSDLFESVEVLSPAAVKARAIEVYEKRRGKRGGPTGTPTTPAAEPTVGDPAGPPQGESDEFRGGPSGPQTDSRGGPCGPHVGVPVGRDTYPRPTTEPTNHADAGFSANVTTSRASVPSEEPDSVAEVERTIPAPPAPAGCDTHPRMPAGLRESDGKPACPVCRATSAPRPDYRAIEAERGRLAPVIQLHRERSSA